MSNKMNTKTQVSARPLRTDISIEKSTESSSTTLIQNDLPQHHLGPATVATVVTNQSMWLTTSAGGCLTMIVAPSRSIWR